MTWFLILLLHTCAQQWCDEWLWLGPEAPVWPVSRCVLMKAWSPSALKAEMTLVACGNLRWAFQETQQNEHHYLFWIKQWNNLSFHLQETVEPDQGSIYRSLVTNTSKEIMSFSDFPVPADYPNYLHNTELLQYFRLYAKHFHLHRYIRFQVTFIDISGVSAPCWHANKVMLTCVCAFHMF